MVNLIKEDVKTILDQYKRDLFKKYIKIKY